MTQTKVISAQSEHQLNNLIATYEKEGYEFLPPLVVTSSGGWLYATMVKHIPKPRHNK